jgi:hypothetical protein
MKLIGRLLCLGVGIFMIFFGVVAIRDNAALLSASGWEDIFAIPEKLQYLTTIAGQGLNCLVCLIAIFAAIRGKRSIKLILIAFIMMIMPAYNTYLYIQAGGTNFWPLVEQYAVPILYFIGMVLV